MCIHDGVERITGKAGEGGDVDEAGVGWGVLGGSGRKGHRGNMSRRMVLRVWKMNGI